MKKSAFLAVVFFLLTVLIGISQNAGAQLKPGEPIVFGVPTALGAIEGRDGWMAVQMAVDEINAKGGVQVGNTKHKLQAYSIDTREHEPGIPVHDALTAMEKLILEKKPHAIVLGNFRSEVLLAAMDVISKYKLPYICSIAMSPLMQKKVTDEYDKSLLSKITS
jgi:branched-chain amino acid transport system substrate-binding protein